MLLFAVLRFEVYNQGEAVSEVDITGAYMFGQDHIPVRADIMAQGNLVICKPITNETCGLSILFDAGQAGKYMLNTTRLPIRKACYVLNLELARARMRELYIKRMDWSMFDFEEAEDLNKEFDELRKLFAAALSHDIENPPQAAKLADEVLSRAIILGEKYALLHSDILAHHRVETSSAGLPNGCCVNLQASRNNIYVMAMKNFGDYISIPLPWNFIAPTETEYKFTTIDAWMNFAARENKDIHSGPIIDFDAATFPDWLSLYQNDYPALREGIFRHINKVVERYKPYVKVWNVISGINSLNSLDFNFDQISEIVRTSCQIVRQLAPNAEVLIELTCPWSEFYSHNIRTIPTLLFTDMITRTDMPFDALGVRLMMGVARDGMYVRDMMRISSLLDDLAYNNKSVYITMCGVPSGISKDKNDIWGGASVKSAGSWHGPWTQRLQAEWLHAVARLALSKSYIKGLCWADLADIPGKTIPHGGLRDKDFKPKLSLKEIYNLRDAWKNIAALGNDDY